MFIPVTNEHVNTFKLGPLLKETFRKALQRTVVLH